MKPPDNTEVFETSLSTLWVDEIGIVCGYSKKIERNIEYYQELINLFKRLKVDGNKFCLLIDSNDSSSLTKEIIEYTSIEYPKYIKAMAILSNKPLERTQINTFLKFNISSFPAMMFSNEKDAREWLNHYL